MRPAAVEVSKVSPIETSAEGKVKTSYDFTPKIKDRLGRLKLDLRLRGVTGVSETSIIEVLIEGAKVTELEAHFRRSRPRR